MITGWVRCAPIQGLIARYNGTRQERTRRNNTDSPGRPNALCTTLNRPQMMHTTCEYTIVWFDVAPPSLHNELKQISRLHWREQKKNCKVRRNTKKNYDCLRTPRSCLWMIDLDELKGKRLKKNQSTSCHRSSIIFLDKNQSLWQLFFTSLWWMIALHMAVVAYPTCISESELNEISRAFNDNPAAFLYFRLHIRFHFKPQRKLICFLIVTRQKRFSWLLHVTRHWWYALESHNTTQ